MMFPRKMLDKKHRGTPEPEAKRIFPWPVALAVLHEELPARAERAHDASPALANFSAAALNRSPDKVRQWNLEPSSQYSRWQYD